MILECILLFTVVTVLVTATTYFGSVEKRKRQMKVEEKAKQAEEYPELTASGS